MFTYNELIPYINNELLNDNALGNHRGYVKLNKLDVPMGIHENDFNFIFDFIVKHNCKAVYQLGNGFGISTLAIALALDKTNGYLITADSFMEEKLGKQENLPNEINSNSRCFLVTKELLKIFKVDHLVVILTGYAPEITNAILTSMKPDFVFLDCPKNDNELIRDLQSLKNNLQEKFAILIHDRHVFSNSMIDYIKTEFGYMPVEVARVDNGRRYCMWLVTNYE